MMVARRKKTPRFPVKPLLYAALALVAGILLIILSQVVEPEVEKVPDATATAPTTAPTTAPAPTRKDKPPAGPDPVAASQSISNLLVLFGAAGIVVGIICIGWFVVAWRNTRPAWKRHNKYPKMR